MEEIIKTLLLEGIDEATIHEVLSVIEEKYEIVDEEIHSAIDKYAVKNKAGRDELHAKATQAQDAELERRYYKSPEQLKAYKENPNDYTIKNSYKEGKSKANISKGLFREAKKNKQLHRSLETGGVYTDDLDNKEWAPRGKQEKNVEGEKYTKERSAKVIKKGKETIKNMNKETKVKNDRENKELISHFGNLTDQQKVKMKKVADKDTAQQYNNVKGVLDKDTINNQIYHSKASDPEVKSKRRHYNKVYRNYDAGEL